MFSGFLAVIMIAGWFYYLVRIRFRRDTSLSENQLYIWIKQTDWSVVPSDVDEGRFCASRIEDGHVARFSSCFVSGDLNVT